MTKSSAILFALQVAIAATFFGAVCGPATAAQADRISLAGQWQFQLDRADAGIPGRWFERSLDQRIKLPGALQNQGFGDDITVDTKWNGEVNPEAWVKGPQYVKYRQPGNIKVPFFLQPEKHYSGAAWYQREVQVPAAWRANALSCGWSGPTGRRVSGWTAGRSVPTRASQRRTITSSASAWSRASTR